MSQLTDGTTILYFVAMNGDVRHLRKTLRDITRPGLNGSEYQDLGNHGPVHQIATTSWATGVAAAEALKQQYESFVGKAVSVTDDRTYTHTNIVILDVDAQIIYTPLQIGLGAGVDHVIRAAWTFQHGG